MQSFRFRTTLLAANLVGLTGLLALPAQATLVSNALTATARTEVNGVFIGSSTQSDSSYVSQYRFDVGGDSSTGASAWGNALGTYRAAADGQGIYNSSGRFEREVKLTNDNGFSTDYSLTFFIYYGSMSAQDNGATGTGFASYDLSIKQNGSTTLFASGATLNSDGTVVTTGTALDGATLSGNSYFWNGTYVNLNLGTLAAGDSTTINFDLLSTAFGNFGPIDPNSPACYGGYGDNVAQAVEFPGGCTGSTYASLGDPGDFAENTGVPRQFVLQETPTNRVPLPGSLPLLGLGLVALAYSRKYRLR